MGLALGLLLAAAVDGSAVVRHASALAALGPHPSGSPRARAAAEFVAAELRDAGVPDVGVQEFELGGRRGVNVVGVVPGTSPERVVVVAHHDTPEGSPGAHEAASGTGLLVELARVMALERGRARTLVFLSLDSGPGAPAEAGGAAYLARLGAEARNVVGVLSLGPLGRKGRTAVLRAECEADRIRTGQCQAASEWWARTAFPGAQSADGNPPFLGDSSAARFVYPAAVRVFRAAGPRGDEAGFLAAGHPGLWLTDVGFLRADDTSTPAADTPDLLDPDALTDAGLVARNALRGMLLARPGGAREQDWLVVFGRVVGGLALLVAAGLALLPSLVEGVRTPGRVRGVRTAQVVLSAILLARHPLVAAFILLVPSLLWLLRTRAAAAFGLLPALSLVLVGFVGWRRGLVAGAWLSLWEIAGFAVVLALAFVPLRPSSPNRPVFKRIGTLKSPKTKAARRRRS
jgi:hypothetical protein